MKQICLIILFSSFIPAPPDAQAFFDNGMTLLKNKEYVKAIGEFTGAISLKPDFGDAYLQRARAKEMLGKRMGFFSAEFCFDLTSALRLGKKEAASKLENTCMGECFTPTSVIADPEVVLCADYNNAALSDLPAVSEKFINLIKLNASGNKISQFPNKIEKMKSLLSLDLSNNVLTQISRNTGNLEFLKFFHLSKNKIAALPPEIKNLKNIQSLLLKQNNLSSLPSEISTLNTLEILDLSFNKLSVLPAPLLTMKNLKIVVLTGNPLHQEDMVKLKSALPQTVIVFE